MKTYSMRKPRRSLDKLINQAKKHDEVKLSEGTHEWIFDKKLRSMRLVNVNPKGT